MSLASNEFEMVCVGVMEVERCVFSVSLFESIKGEQMYSCDRDLVGKETTWKS